MTDTPQPNPFTDVRPYRPPVLHDIATRRPGGLTAVCIIAIVLGVMGLFSGTMKGVSALFGQQMQQAFGSIGPSSPAQDKLNQEMQAAINAEMQGFTVVSVSLSVCQLVLCGVLLYSAVKTLGLKAAGRKLLLAACICLLAYEIAQLIVFIFQQLSLSPIMELYMPRIMKESSGNNAGAEKIGQAMARMAIIFGIVTQCVWTLIKFVYYAVASRYLCKTNIMTLFNPSPAPAPLKPEST